MYIASLRLLANLHCFHFSQPFLQSNSMNTNRICCLFMGWRFKNKQPGLIVVILAWSITQLIWYFVDYPLDLIVWTYVNTSEKHVKSRAMYKSRQNIGLFVESATLIFRYKYFSLVVIQIFFSHLNSLFIQPFFFYSLLLKRSFVY